MNNQEKLIKVFQALDSMEVKGFANVSILAGSMQILQEVIQELDVPQESEEAQS